MFQLRFGSVVSFHTFQVYFSFTEMFFAYSSTINQLCFIFKFINTDGDERKKLLNNQWREFSAFQLNHSFYNLRKTEFNFFFFLWEKAKSLFLSLALSIFLFSLSSHPLSVTFGLDMPHHLSPSLKIQTILEVEDFCFINECLPLFFKTYQSMISVWKKIFLIN